MRPLVHIVVVSLVSLYVYKVIVANDNLGDVNVHTSSSESSNEKDETITTITTEKAKTEGRTGSRLKSGIKGVQHKAHGVAGKLYESVHGKTPDVQTEEGFVQKVSGFLAGVGEIVRQKAYTTAGNLYEKADPTRYYWGKAWKVISKISLEKMSQKEQLDTLVDAFTKEITEVIPKSTTIKPIEVGGKGLKYVCASDGRIHDLSTLRHLKTKVKKTDDKVTVEVTYTFDNMYFTYDTFYLDISVFKLRGKLVIKYKANQVTLVLGIPHISKLILNIFRKNCIVQVLSFTVETLEFDELEIIADSEFRKGRIKPLMSQYVAANEAKFKKRFEGTVLAEIHRALAVSGTWICKHANMGELVENKGGTLEEFVAGDQFRKFCGQNKP